MSSSNDNLVICRACPEFRGEDGEKVKCRAAACCGNQVGDVHVGRGRCPRWKWGSVDPRTVDMNTPIELFRMAIDAPLNVIDGIYQHNTWPRAGWQGWPNVTASYRQAVSEFVADPPAYPGGEGDGIIIAASDPKYVASAYVTVRMLRHVGCTLPIQIWHCGRLRDWLPCERKAVEDHGAQMVDADEVAKTNPHRCLNGWELKAYALVNCSFRRVIFLDADCYPARDPAEIFQWKEFSDYGAVLWPNSREYDPTPQQCSIFDVRHEVGWVGTESSMLAFDRERCCKPLALTDWFNRHSDFYYFWVYGDQETFAMAFRRLSIPFAMPVHRYAWEFHTSVHHDFAGRWFAMHRCRDKARLSNALPHAAKYQGQHSQRQTSAGRPVFPVPRRLSKSARIRPTTASDARRCAAVRARIPGSQCHGARFRPGQQN